MEVIYFVVLLVLAFGLGACPFSVWIGRGILGKNIRNYGDGNPGAYNVMRAGGRWAFAMALVADIGKGVPFVALAYYYFGLPMAMVMAVGLGAILGHAFSPILRLHGGKSLGVTAGVMLALPQHEILISVLIFMLLAFLLTDVDAWRVIFALSAATVYLLIADGLSLEPLFVVCVIAILAVKHLDDLKTTRPRLGGKLITWYQTKKAAHNSRQ
jgi:glycerol-3-phosphate acyltransferase PlsY